MIAQVCKRVSNNTRVNRMGTPFEGVIARVQGLFVPLGQMHCIYICWVHSGELD